VNFSHTGQTNCSGCHTPPAGHYPGQCSDCHNTEDWDDFEHNGSNLNCIGCHLDDEPDDPDHPKGQQCSDCHNTEDWEIEEAAGGLIASLFSLDEIAACNACHHP
jgi:hypothetical protein